MTGSYLYFIGCLAVFTEMMERRPDLWAAMPPEVRRLVWLVVAIAAIGWPVFATVIVIIRFVKAFRNG